MAQVNRHLAASATGRPVIGRGAILKIHHLLDQLEDLFIALREPSNPVLDLGEPGELDEKGAFVPSVVLRDTQYQLYYL